MAKVVVLDVDGTLMDTNYQHTEAWARAFAAVSLHPPRAEIHRHIGEGAQRLIQSFVQDEEAAEKVNELHSEHYAELQESAYPLPGAEELISSLAGRGYGVWFVTSAKPDELQRHQEQLQTEGKLAGIVSSSDVESSKPAPDIFEQALDRAGVEPGEAVAVGDAVWDVESARDAGVRTVAVLTGGAFGEEELRKAGAVEVYRDCAGILSSSFPE